MGPIAWFEELGRSDVPLVGGKGAGLGELTGVGLPVPPGFVVTAATYLQVLDETGLRSSVRALIDSVLLPETEPDLETASAQLISIVGSLEMPQWLSDDLGRRYADLSARTGEAAPFVAVRSSAPGEDTAATSFAGIHRSFMNVRGVEELVSATRDCWASAYVVRALDYRRSQHIPDEPAIAVVVQHMIDSERAGIAFSMNPITGDRDEVVVEAAYGQGEIVVSGRVEPDTYTVSKAGPKIVSVHIGHKTTKIVRGPDGHDRTLPLDPADTEHRVLTDDEVLDVARMAMSIEAHYAVPMDIEWAFAGGRLYLLQARPVTALGPSVAKNEATAEPPPSASAPQPATVGDPTTAAPSAEPTLLLRGLGVSPGIASGICSRRVRVRRCSPARSSWHR
jgi:pyruvate, water dikinase